jgi:hypothetical protein
VGACFPAGGPRLCSGLDTPGSPRPGFWPAASRNLVASCPGCGGPGDVEAATNDLDDLPEPLVLPSGAESPSQALARLRNDER